jgi:hypothetical protein
MSDDNFLSRWSRRKREIAKADAQEAQLPPEPLPTEPLPSDAQRADALAEAAPEAEPDSEVDLSSLPSLESITGSTDITCFLRRGVPDELARSALRKAWVSDPTIRDFIGIAENQWDFNDAASIPGFGALDVAPDEVRQMAAKLVGDVQQAAEKIDEAVQSAGLGVDAPQQIAGNSAPCADVDSPDTVVATQDVPKTANFASQQEEQDSPADSSKPRRHGGALPR